MNLQSRSQIILALGLIALFIIGIFFYFLNRADNRIQTDSIPTNQSFEVIDSAGNVQTITSSGTVIQAGQVDNDNQDQLVSIADGPVAGYRVIENDFGSSIRYIESDTGYVYEYLVASDTQTRLTTTTLPRISNANWISDTELLITYNENGRSVNYFASLDLQTGELSGTIFPSNLVSIVSPDQGESIYYLLSDDFGSSLYRYSPDSGKSTFQQGLPLSDLRLFSSQDLNSIYAVSKPNGKTKLALIEINLLENQYQVLNQNTEFINGALVTDISRLYFNPDEAVLVAQEGNSSIIEGSFIAEKCGTSNITGDEIFCAKSNLTLNQQRNWPINWYRGQLRPNEAIVAIEPEFGTTTTVIELGDQFDVSNVSVTEDYVYFIGRRTGQLYQLRRSSF